MRIIQSGSTGAALILQEQIKYLLCDVVGIRCYLCFFFCRHIHNSISLVLDYREFFISVLLIWSSIVGTTSVASIFQTFFHSEIL